MSRELKNERVVSFELVCHECGFSLMQDFDEGCVYGNETHEVKYHCSDENCGLDHVLKIKHDSIHEIEIELKME